MALSKQRTLKFVSLITAVLFLLVVLSCSTTNTVKDGYADRRQKKGKVTLSKLVEDQFFQRVKPVQKDIDELYGLAVRLQKLHRHYPAIETFKEILRQDSGNIEALNGIAVSSDFIGAHAAAAIYYQQALKVNPKLDYIWNNLGYCYFLQNQMDLSIDAYQTAIAINPDLQKYRNNLAMVSAKQNQIPGSPNKRPPPIVLAKIAPKKGLENRVSRSVINQRPSTIDRVPIETVAQKKTDKKNGIISQQIDTVDLESVQRGALKPFPITQSSKELESKELEPEQATPSSDLRVNPFLQEYTKNDNRDRKKGNRRYTEKIPFKSLPFVKSVQNIAEIKRPKINIQAREPVEVDTAVMMTKATKPFSSYQASIPKQSSDGLVIIPPSIEDQIGSMKRLQVNPRFKKKRADKKIGLKRRTMVAKQRLGIQIFGLEVSNGNGVPHLARNVSTHLKKKGVQVSRVTNATHFQYSRSKLYYLKGLLEKARKLARIIPGILVVEVPAFDHDQVHIKLLLGKDVSSAGMLL